jgi:hypothetical protein
MTGTLAWVVHLYKRNGAWIWVVFKDDEIVLRSKKPDWTEERAVRRALGAIERYFGEEGPPPGFSVSVLTDQETMEQTRDGEILALPEAD